MGHWGTVTTSPVDIFPRMYVVGGRRGRFRSTEPGWNAWGLGQTEEGTEVMFPRGWQCRAGGTQVGRLKVKGFNARTLIKIGTFTPRYPLAS